MTRERSCNAPPKVTSPQEFFGFQLGADRKIARWDKIVEYFHRLEAESDKIKVVEMGKTTEGNPFLLVIISSPENLAELERYKAINKRITDPRGVPEEEIKALVKEGKAIVCQSMSLHATEIGGTQMSPELAYDLLTQDSDSTRQILDSVIFLMVPCFNPDGEIMVADWYEKWLGTEYEGVSVPWLYHKYAGHDNNRDAFALNLPESRYMAEILFTEWRPHAYQDHHHMGSTGARLYLAPYSDAIRPYADPLVWREDSWFGAHMAYSLEEAGKTGILNAAQYPGWGHFGFHWITTHHNIAGMLTESASAKLATPVYIHPHQLRGASPKTMPKYEAQTNFPHPWPGGWWRLRDIVEQQKIAAYALLEIAAKFKEKVLWNAYLKAKRQTERGAAGKPKAYIISRDQHDPLTARKLVRLLLAQGIDIEVAESPILVDGRLYPPGSYVISLAQPKMGVIKSLLGRTFYPDSYWTRNPDGSPIMYDTATDTIGEFMGVKVDEIDSPVTGKLAQVREIKVGTGPDPAVQSPAEHVKGYLLDPRLNDTFVVVNRLLSKGIRVLRLEEPVCATSKCCGSGGDMTKVPGAGAEGNPGANSGGSPGGNLQGSPGGHPAGDLGSSPGDNPGSTPLGFSVGYDFLSQLTKETVSRCHLPEGAFYVEDSPETREVLALSVADLGLPFYRVQSEPEAKKHDLKRLRVGMYQRYWGGNMDEGWTRFVLEKFEFPYVTLRDDDFKAGNLNEKVDVIILPSDRSQMIIGPDNQDRDGRSRPEGRWPIPPMPPEYRSGIGKEGVKALREFVEKGGKLLAFDMASDFAIETLGLRVRNVVANTTFKEFYCHGSTLRVKVDTRHPYGYGMPDQALVMNFGSPTFEVTDNFAPENYQVVAEYPEKNLLQSGWLIGEERMAKKPCMIAARVKHGEVVLFGFRPQFRAQMHGTFKLVFNCLLA